MSKIILVTDTHLGCRGNSKLFLEYMYWYWSEKFVPYCLENDIDTMIHLGDFFDNRSSVNLLTLSYFNRLLMLFSENNLTMHCIVGNHDLYYRDTSDISSIGLLSEFMENSPLNVIDQYTELTIGKTDFALVPWINKTNYEEITEKFKTTKANVCLGHFEVEGFKMYKTSSISEGLNREIFKRFDFVGSGHYHHGSRVGNIAYIGSMFPMNWSDYDDARGFIVFDTDNGNMEFVENDYSLFVQMDYDGNGDTCYVEGALMKPVKDCFVRLNIYSVENEAVFDEFLQLIKSSAEDVTVIDHRQIVQSDVKDVDVEDLGKDTLELANEYYDENIPDEKDRIKIKELFLGIYEKSLPIFLAGE